MDTRKIMYQVVNILKTKRFKTRFKTEMLGSHLCDYSDVYIVVEVTRDLLAAAANEKPKTT